MPGQTDGRTDRRDRLIDSYQSVIGNINVTLDQAKFLCSLPKILGQHPDNGKDITLNSGRFGPYLKCENKSARIENIEEICLCI